MSAAEPLKILLFDPDADVRDALQEVLEAEGFGVTAAAQLTEAAAAAHRADVVLAIVDVRPEMLRDEAKMEFVGRLAQDTRVGLLSTASSALEAAAERFGAAFSLQKPFDIEALLASVARATALVPVPAPQEDLVRRYFRALSSKDFDSLRGVCSESVRYHLPGNGSEFARTVEGRHAFIPFARETFSRFQDAVFEVEAIYATPESIVARYRGTWGPADARQELPGAVIFRLQEERISEIGIRTDVRRLG